MHKSFDYSGADLQDQTNKPHDGQLHGFPVALELQEVQTSGPTALDEVSEDGCGEKLRVREKHRWDAPFEATSSADRVKEPIGGHVATQDVAGVDAEGSDESEHGEPHPSRIAAHRDDVDGRRRHRLARPPRNRRAPVGRDD